MKLIKINGEYQCPKCFRFFKNSTDHIKCSSDKRRFAKSKSLNTIDSDPDMYGQSWKADN